MKASQLIFSSLVTATAWAKHADPFVFFAKIGTNYIPLSGMPFKESTGNYYILSYGDSTASPVEFIPLEDSRVYTHNSASEGYAGFADFSFVFGPDMGPMKVLVEQGQVTSRTFYSCKMPGSDFRGIRSRPRSSSDKNCFDVEIYFLPYDSKKGTAVIDRPQTDEDAKKVGEFYGNSQYGENDKYAFNYRKRPNGEKSE